MNRKRKRNQIAYIIYILERIRDYKKEVYLC